MKEVKAHALCTEPGEHMFQFLNHKITTNACLLQNVHLFQAEPVQGWWLCRIPHLKC
jgi:hypothetical protein